MGKGGRRSTTWLPAWNLGKTKVIRIPEAIADELIEIARRMDEDKNSHVTGNIETINSHVTGDSDKIINSHVTDNKTRSDSAEDGLQKIDIFMDGFKELIEKVENKEAGYKNNSFGEGIKRLKFLNELLSKELN